MRFARAASQTRGRGRFCAPAQMLVTGHLDNRQGRRQRARQFAQPGILRIGERRVAGAFQLDAQRNHCRSAGRASKRRRHARRAGRR